MSHLFEVRLVANRLSSSKWKITSADYIEVDLYRAMFKEIKAFILVATGVFQEDYHIYEIQFYASQERSKLFRMFPRSIVEPIQTRCPNRIFVYYDRENNVYVPFDDPSM